MNKIDRTGEIGVNNQGLKMTIVRYINSDNIDIEFEDGFVVKNRQYTQFQRGCIKNMFFKNIYNIAFVGGKVLADDTIIYNKWRGMLERCYDKKTQQKQPTYKGCSVCEEWCNYQKFAKWYKDNFWSEDCTYLDKDILIKGNKIYSPDTCVLVDNRLNCLFTKNDILRNDLPVGITRNVRCKTYRARCNTDNTRKHIGCFNTVEEAFQAYKRYKENYIKQVADEYKSKYENFPKKLYEAMYNYKVEIDD